MHGANCRTGLSGKTQYASVLQAEATAAAAQPSKARECLPTSASQHESSQELTPRMQTGQPLSVGGQRSDKARGEVPGTAAPRSQAPKGEGPPLAAGVSEGASKPAETMAASTPINSLGCG